MKKNRLISKAILIPSIIILLSALFLPVPRSVNTTMICTVLDQSDPDYSSQVLMTVQGTYTDFLFLQDHFEGRIYLPEHDLYGGNNPIFHVKIGDFDHINLMYTDQVNMPHYPGSFYASEDMESCFLWLMVPREDKPNTSTSRYFICHPQMSLDDLYTIIDGK